MVEANSYSAQIAMYLDVNGTRIEVASCLANRCILREPVDMPPCHASLVIRVDGYEYRRQVELRQGISQHSRTVELAC